jgi:hypothetical protein
MNKAADVRGGVLLWNKLDPTKVPEGQAERD